MNWQPGHLLHLTTNRFVLRSATREDVTDAFLGWLADPEVMVGLNLPRKRFTRTQAVRFVLNHNNQNNFFLMICRGDNRRSIGFFVINVDLKNEVAETSVVIGDREHWGKNVVVECRSALLDFLFDEMNMFKVQGKPHGRNFSSIFNYKAMGFECEAVLRQQMRSINDDSRLDQLVFAMFNERWQSRKLEKS